ncbi:flagellar hook-length control protein FliK [Variovorax sp. J22R24]|uniref:flagellar hook-length control protein FliK n=1 Tax=Variovorax gracilis TaxID=3053502 RepID=UPI0025751517|nr:flagellar hook-length control protein FliK [Variovorax sp. J22R24]MDM0104354.1 flagellar hook-length control protein FliK [Variovorax sp. J22R24]
MPTLISTSVNVPGTSVSSTGPRGRGAEQAEGRSFGAVLDRSRAASNAGAQEASADTDPSASVASRKLARAAEKKSQLTAEDVMALLAPLPAHIAPIAVDAKAGAALASRGAKAVGTVADGTAPEATPAALDGDGAALAATSTEAAAEQATGAVAAAQGDAKDGKPAATPESAADPSFKDALAQSAPADAATGSAAASTAARPGVGTATTPAAPADPAIVATATADKAKVSAAADKAQPAPPLQAADSIKVAAAADAAGSSFDTSSESSPQPLPQLQSAAPLAERAGTPSGSTPVLSVAPPVGSDEWGPAIGQQMIRMSASGHQVAELNLNPAGLGPLKVTLTMGDSQAQAMFVSAHEGVRKAVEAALPQLRTTLAEQGISLGQTSVGAETRQPFGQDAAFAQQNPSRSPNQPDYPGAGRSGNATAPASTSAPSAPLRHSTAGLDTFA